MKKHILYTFRTNPFIPLLKEKFGEVFVFGKLNQDLDNFSNFLINNDTDMIIGFAKSDESKTESVAINKFNNFNILKKGKDRFDLFIPNNSPFHISNKPTNSFCNYTMYKISNLIEHNNLKTKLAFIHFKEKDFEKLTKFIGELK